MRTDTKVGLLSVLLLVPALLLVGNGVLFDGRYGPEFLFHPIMVMTGLGAGLALNLIRVLRVRVSHEAEGPMGTVAVRWRGTGLNLAILLLGLVLLAVIAGYLFVENYQPRVIE